MSPLSLLVLASIGAALAFFFAGMLLRGPRRPPPPRARDLREGPEKTGALAGQLASVRAESERLADALSAAQKQCQAEGEARKREQADRLSAEHERDDARAELLRLAAKEKTLAERLRVAEDNSRATFEQVETSAAAWEAQWQAAKAEHQQREQALERELEQLRGQCQSQARENQRLAAACQQQASEKAEAQRAAGEAMRSLAETESRARSEQEMLAREEEHRRIVQEKEEERRRAVEEREQAYARERELRSLLEQTAADWQMKLDRSEADWRARLDASEASWQAKVDAAERTPRSDGSALESERQQRAEQLQGLRADSQREREENQQLALALRAAEEALAAERGQSQAVVREAESRLRELDRLARENSELRAEQARLAEAVKRASDQEGETKDAKVALALAQAKLAELGQVLEENRKLRDEVADLRVHREASNELERLTAAHKQLRLDAELMARRLQELLHDRAELVPLRAQAAEAASLLEEVTYLRRREKDLEAQLYASGFYASREIPVSGGEIPVQTPVSDMETNLDSLLGEDGPRTAVLADAQGFLIAGAGESVAQEGLAAFAAVAGEMVSRARMLLPLAEIGSVRVTDANRMVLTCHLFESDGQGLGVATLGPGDPPAEKTQRAVGELAAIVSGAGDAPEDDTGEAATPTGRNDPGTVG
jgi:hypothetical protein